MKTKRLILKRALMPDGWRDKVALDINDAGIIIAIDQGGKGEIVGGLTLPGLPNLHSHAFQRGFAGLTERAGDSIDSFWTWREAMYRFALSLTPEDNEAIAAMAFMEMLEGGFTSLAEFHYIHHAENGAHYSNIAEMAERICAAARETGIGLTLLPVFYAHSDFLGVPPHEGQRRFINDVDSYARLIAGSAKAVKSVPHGRLGLAPHSLRAATIEEVKALLTIQSACPIHIHIAEQTKEVDDCVRSHGLRPIEFLFNEVEVNSRWCLIHATHATLSERNAMVEADVVAGLCPITEANLGDGLFSAADYQVNGGFIGIGSDSNVEINALREIQILEYGQRLSLRRRNAMAGRNASTGRTLFDLVLAGGSRALGQKQTGLEVGARADFFTLDLEHPALACRSDDAALDSAIFAGGASAIHQVYTLGNRVVDGGRHIRRETIEARFRAALKRLVG